MSFYGNSMCPRTEKPRVVHLPDRRPARRFTFKPRHPPNVALELMRKVRRKLTKTKVNQVLSADVWTNRAKALKNEYLLTKSYRDKLKSEYLYEENESANAKPVEVPIKGHYRTVIRTPPRDATALDLSVSPINRQGIQYFENYSPITPPPSAAIVRSGKETLAKRKPLRAHPQVKIRPNFKHSVIEMSAGKYLNFGLARMIQQNCLGWMCSSIVLTVAAYLHKEPKTPGGTKTGKYMFILGQVKSTESILLRAESKPFVIGIYCGAFPQLTIGNEIFEPFVAEMVGINKHGLKKMCTAMGKDFNGMPEHTYYEGTVYLNAIIVDPLSGSLFTGSVLPTSAYGCPKCCLKGQLQFNTTLTSFPSSSDTHFRRTDDDFKLCLDQTYHLCAPITKQLGIGLVTQVIPDYKHYVCMGVMKRFWTLWTTGSIDYRLNADMIQSIDAQLIAISEHIPVEFRYGPEPLSNVEYWQAYDWRQFLFYYGPIVLETALQPEYFNHFRTLHMIMRLITNGAMHDKQTIVGLDEMLKSFVAEFATLYGEKAVDHHVHALLHFVGSFKQFGCIEDLGGFVFDEQLDIIVNALHEVDKYKEPLDLEAIYRRVMDGNASKFGGRRDMSTYVDENSNLHYRGFLIKTSHPDNYVVTTMGPLKLAKIVEEEDGFLYVVGEPIASLINEDPAKKFLVSVDLDHVISKGMRFDTDRGIYIMPMTNI